MANAGSDRHNEEAAVAAREVVDQLRRCVSPTSEDLDALVRVAIQLYAPELAARARALVGRWRAGGCVDPNLDLAEALLTAASASTSARARLRSWEDRTEASAAAEAVNCLFRGDLQAAMDVAHAYGWFLDSVELTECLCYALLAAAFGEQYELAQTIIDTWKRRYAGRYLEKAQLVLQVESRVAYMQQQFPRELALLEDADAICREYDLTTARLFLEPALAGALVHCGELTAARGILREWPDATGGSSPLDGMRNMMRVDLALLDGDHDLAWRVAQDLLTFGLQLQNVTQICEARFYLALTAPKEYFAEELVAYRRLAYRYQSGRHLKRLRVLEQLSSAGLRTMRHASVTIRSRHSEEQIPLFRLWLPAIEWMGADLYIDRVRGLLQFRGHGPFSLQNHPILQKALLVVLDHPDLSVRFDELFVAVWGGRYDPLIHEGKVHVTMHRLRRWLNKKRPGAGKLLVVCDGFVGFAADAELRQVTLERRWGAIPTVEPTTSERLLQYLSSGEPAAPKDLERTLGISRSQLNQVVRVLVAKGDVARVGRGRATRYSVPER